MWDAIGNMYNVLKNGGKCIIIIGNNNFAVNGVDREFRNGDFLEQIALNKEIGFTKWQDIIIQSRLLKSESSHESVNKFQTKISGAR